METQNFKLLEINSLSRDDAKQYLAKYFIWCLDGNHYMLENNEYKKIKVSLLKKVYFARMSQFLFDYYFHGDLGPSPIPPNAPATINIPIRINSI